MNDNDLISRTFADCPNLQQVIFPGSPDSIAEDYLEGCEEVKVMHPGKGMAGLLLF